MILAKVKKLDGTQLDHGNFETQEQAMTWFQKFIDKGVYGKKHTPAREVDAVLDEQGNVITPAYVEPEVAAEFVIEFEEVVPSQEEIKAAKIEAGKKARETCQVVLDLIAGYNLDRELTIEQITLLQNTLANPESALRAGRPSLAKMLINSIVPDGDLITNEMKTEALEILKNY